MRWLKPLVLFGVGGLTYILMELMWRGYTHWTMFFVGGLAFVLIGAINEVIPWNMPLWMQSIIGALIITSIEFVSGCIINLWLGWNVWDYSSQWMNFLGQVCPLFSFFWFVLTFPLLFLSNRINRFFQAHSLRKDPA